MQIFGDILKEEETTGGFEPNTPEDQTFYLEKINNYPEELPFLPKKEEPFLETTPQAIEETEKADLIDVNQVDSVWDAFEIPQVIEAPQAINETENVQNIEQTEVEITNIPTLDSSLETTDTQQEETPTKIEEGEIEILIPPKEELKEIPEDIITEAKPTEEEINIGNIDNIPVLQEEEKNQTAPIENEIVQISEELKKLIEQDLERSKQKTKKQVEDETPIQTGETLSKEFEPVENTGEYKLIDLTNLDFDKPSTLNISKPSDSEPPKEEPVKIEDEKQSEEEPKEVTKTKTKINMKKKLVPAIIILLILGLAGGTYYLFENELLFFSKEEKKDTSAIAKKTAEKPTPPKTEADTTKKITAKTETKDTQPAPSTAEIKTQPKEEVKHKEEIKPQEEKIQKKDEKLAEKKSEPKITKAKTKQEEITPKSAPITPITPKVEKKTTKIKPEKPQKSITKKAPQEPETNISQKVKKNTFTIEIYRTPSYEDAQIWLAKIKAKGFSNAHITSQKVRNNVIYKVRFGTFSSLSEAIETAKNSGFNQISIDRIK